MAHATDQALTRLSQSSFRARFHLGPKELAYLRERGIDAVSEQARAMLEQRIGDAHPRHDGKQTPMRGHPVFVAQHATGTCCRSCAFKWHGVPKGRPLGEQDLSPLVAVIRAWLQREAARAGTSIDPPRQPGLFT